MTVERLLACCSSGFREMWYGRKGLALDINLSGFISPHLAKLLESFTYSANVDLDVRHLTTLLERKKNTHTHTKRSLQWHKWNADVSNLICLTVRVRSCNLPFSLLKSVADEEVKGFKRDFKKVKKAEGRLKEEEA